MPDGPKSPSRPTVKRLFALSGNLCTFEDCPTPLVDRDTGSIVGEVCHIRGEKPTAPRYDASQDNQSRHGFDNLMLLCNVHHKVIDDNLSDYPVDRLLAMKTEHETRDGEKEACDDATSEVFTSFVVNSFGDRNEVVQAAHVSGGQVAHTIINNSESEEADVVEVEGKTTISSGQDSVGCPFLTLIVVCRSKRPAKIRKALISLYDHGIIAALEAGFDESFAYDPLPGSKEELTVELFPMQEPNSSHGFVLERDDAARFLLPVLAAPVGLFLIRPPDAMSLKVEFFDESRQIVVDGDNLKGQLEGLVEIAKKMKCEARFPPVKLNVTVKSLSPPEAGPVGKVNPNPITFGLRVGSPKEPSPERSKTEAAFVPWFSRQGKFVDYPEVLQGNLPLCVYSAVAAAVNHLSGKEVWSPEDLFVEHGKGSKPTNFSVAETALSRVSETITKHHHNTNRSSETLTPELIRGWIDDDGVVILSMELRNDEVSQRDGWHMFSLMAHEDDRFQVWDTNGLKGFITDEEVSNGFYYPNGWFFMPHDTEDTLVLRRKK